MFVLPTVLRTLLIGCGLPVFAGAAQISLGFESGLLTGFSLSGQGNAGVLSSLGALTPAFGNNMAILSNGPGDAGGSFDAVLLLSNTFNLLSSDMLAFSFLRLTAEFTGNASDPGRLDAFEINLLDAGGALVQSLYSSTVADPGFAAISGGPVTTPMGDTFYDATAWQPISLTGLSGTFRLAFIVRDAGDNSFDSAFLLDGDTQATGPTVPEPSTFYLLSGAGALLLVRALRRRSV